MLQRQFAVVVTNPHSVAIDVKVELNQAAFGESPMPVEIQNVVVPPGGLEVFKLPKREVDGSSPEGLNDGTHTAVSSNAFRVESSHPIIAYQFNPLENVNVFSNDASLLKPVEALTYDPGFLSEAYVVVGWPQTIAHTDDPRTNYNPQAPIDLRSFLTLIGTRPNTRVRVTTTTRVGYRAHWLCISASTVIPSSTGIARSSSIRSGAL